MAVPSKNLSGEWEYNDPDKEGSILTRARLSFLIEEFSNFLQEHSCFLLLWISASEIVNEIKPSSLQLSDVTM